jgi:hypothetical protein
MKPRVGRRQFHPEFFVRRVFNRYGNTAYCRAAPASNFALASAIAARFLRTHNPNSLTGSSNERPSYVS